MSGNVSVGIIGGGMIGVMHTRAFNALEGVSVRWLAEPVEDLRTQVAEEHGIRHTTGDYREMLGDRNLDAVIVCTPPHLHKSMGMDIIGAGKHMLMEKPLSLTLDEARELVAEVRKHPELVVSGCSARHARLNPKYRIIKELIDHGKLGTVYHIHHCETDRQSRPGIEYNPSATWFLSRTQAGGGPLLDWGVYDLSFHLGLVNEPQFLGAEGFCVNHLDTLFPEGEGFVEEHGAAFLRFENGLTYYWERANNAHNEPHVQTRIYGTRGGVSLAFPTWFSPEVTFCSVDSDGKTRKEVLWADMAGWPGDIEAFDAAFADAVRNGGPAPMDSEIELKNLEIIDTVYKAAKW